MSGKNFSAEQLLKLLSNSQGSQPDSSMAEDLLKNKLSGDQRAKVEAILQDKDALDRLLSSRQAQELMKKLGGK